jgi:NADPH:quinone reductase
VYALVLRRTADPPLTRVRAYQLTEYGGVQSLTEVDVASPEPGPNELLVDVEAIGLNFYDELMTRGLYQHRPELPVVPGSEVAGTVAQAPAGSGFGVGDRVAGFVLDGGFASRARVPVGAAVHMPAEISAVTAAAATVNYHTSEFALSHRARLTAGEYVLVLGATGALGTAAVQVAANHGAHVIAGARRAIAGDHPVLRAAAATVELAPGFAAGVREMTDGRGVDVVFDPVGGWLTEEATRALRVEGRLLIVGFATAEVPRIRANRLLLNNVTAVGAGMGAFIASDPGLLGRQAKILNRWLVERRIEPHIARVTGFEELPAALADIGQGRAGGKVVVELA